MNFFMAAWIVCGFVEAVILGARLEQADSRGASSAALSLAACILFILASWVGKK